MPAGETSISGAWRAIGRTDVILASVLAVVLLPTSLLALVQSADPVSVPEAILLAGLFALVHVFSLVAIRFPRTAFVGASIVMFVLAVLPGAGGIPAAVYPSSFAYLLCIGQVAAHCERRVSAAALGIAVLGAGIIAVVPTLNLELHLRFATFVGLAALVTLGWAIGMLQRLRQQQIDNAERVRVQQAIAAERMRINRDLHDVVAHSMTVMIAQAEVARALAHEDPQASSRALSVVVDTGRDALRGMRAIVAESADEPLETVPDIDTIVRDVDAVRSARTTAAFNETGTRGVLDPASRIALRQAVREALTNAIRHTSPPQNINVQMDWDGDRVVTTVVDDGGSSSAAPGEKGPGAGIGLISMAERVRSAGGTLSAAPADAAGWIVRIELPYGRGEI